MADYRQNMGGEEGFVETMERLHPQELAVLLRKLSRETLLWGAQKEECLDLFLKGMSPKGGRLFTQDLQELKRRIERDKMDKSSLVQYYAVVNQWDIFKAAEKILAQRSK